MTASDDILKLAREFRGRAARYEDGEPVAWVFTKENLSMLVARLRSAPEAAASEAAVGWKLVPVEPTDAMLDKGGHAIYEPTNRYDLERAWGYMIDAAPTPASVSDSGAEPTPTPREQRIDDFISGAAWRQANPDEASLRDLKDAANWWVSNTRKDEAAS